MRPLFILTLISTLLSACTSTRTVSQGVTFAPDPLRDAMQAAVAKPNIGGVGVAIIKGGEIDRTLYAGEARPGVPVTGKSWFNTASVSKTLIAETVLRLVDRGALSLDDRIAAYFRHPDLANDARYELLTPRLILSHQTTLKNWAYNYDDDKLAFQGTPGNGEISYSGAAIEILMRYLEARFEIKYPALVQRELVGPLNISGINAGRHPKMESHVVHGINKDGEWQDAFRRSQGGSIIGIDDYSAADNMFATVPGYAELLTAIVANRKLRKETATQRAQLLSSGSKSNLGFGCTSTITFCPNPFGYGLGWILFGDGDQLTVMHGGNDFAEHAQVWFDVKTGDGMVMFINGGNAFADGLDIIEAVAPDNPMLRYYRALISEMQRKAAQASK